MVPGEPNRLEPSARWCPLGLASTETVDVLAWVKRLVPRACREKRYLNQTLFGDCFQIGEDVRHGYDEGRDDSRYARSPLHAPSLSQADVVKARRLERSAKVGSAS